MRVIRCVLAFVLFARDLQTCKSWRRFDQAKPSVWIDELEHARKPQVLQTRLYNPSESVVKHIIVVGIRPRIIKGDLVVAGDWVIVWVGNVDVGDWIFKERWFW